MQTGWKTIDGKFYFFKEVNPNKGVRLTGLRTVKGHVYYLDKKDNGAAPYRDSGSVFGGVRKL